MNMEEEQYWRSVGEYPQSWAPDMQAYIISRDGTWTNNCMAAACSNSASKGVEAAIQRPVARLAIAAGFHGRWQPSTGVGFLPTEELLVPRFHGQQTGVQWAANSNGGTVRRSEF